MTATAFRNRPLKILVFEFATSGGVGGRDEDHALVADLWDEGETMRRALTADLIAAGYDVVGLLTPDHPDPDHPAPSVPPDHAAATSLLPDRGGRRTPNLPNDASDGPSHDLQHLRSAVRAVDATILIAPESGGLLQRLAQVVREEGGKLLSPDPDFIDLTADKQRLAEYLGTAGIPVPLGRSIAPGQQLRLPVPPPWVMKPRDGAGSMGMTRLDKTPSEPALMELRLEAYCPGQAVSVAALTGPRGSILLEPCRQQLRDTLHFEYLGGSLPLPAELRERAIHLARRTLQSLPETQGYVGMDMVLGARAGGEGDVLIEVNPRLTTSYAGLRQAVRGNLAKAMVEVAWGDTELTELVFGQDELQFLGSTQ
jgi:tyramine---L-glutamate ligase